MKKFVVTFSRNGVPLPPIPLRASSESDAIRQAKELLQPEHPRIDDPAQYKWKTSAIPG
jgi:hypothetical protein